MSRSSSIRVQAIDLLNTMGGAEHIKFKNVFFKNYTNIIGEDKHVSGNGESFIFGTDNMNTGDCTDYLLGSRKYIMNFIVTIDRNY